MSDEGGDLMCPTKWVRKGKILFCWWHVFPIFNKIKENSNKEFTSWSSDTKVRTREQVVNLDEYFIDSAMTVKYYMNEPGNAKTWMCAVWNISDREAVLLYSLFYLSVLMVFYCTVNWLAHAVKYS